MTSRSEREARGRAGARACKTHAPLEHEQEHDDARAHDARAPGARHAMHCCMAELLDYDNNNPNMRVDIYHDMPHITHVDRPI